MGGVHPTAIFQLDGDFAALDAARTACKAAGFSVGTHQAHAPTGLLLGSVAISKWRNMTKKEQGQLHGQMWGGRDGRATVMLHADAPAAAVAAFQDVLAAADQAGTTIEPLKALQHALLLALPVCTILCGALAITP